MTSIILWKIIMIILNTEYVNINIDMYNVYTVYVMMQELHMPYQRKAVKEELKNYFNVYKERKHNIGDEYIWNVYKGFKVEKFNVE